MSEPIKVGDLVMVVGAPCPHTTGEIGMAAIVESFVTACSRCAERCASSSIASTLHARIRYPDGDIAYKPPSWLLKLPPLTEPDSIERREEITA